MKTKTQKNQGERLSAAVRSVLNGKYSKSMAIIMYAKPTEYDLFKITIEKHTKNVFC